jgi:O-antigen ligase
MMRNEMNVDELDATSRDTLADAPGRRDRMALRLLQIGAPLTVLAAVTWFEYELDRFYVPKELALHAFTFVCGLLLFGAMRRSPRLRVELVLGIFLLLSIVSSALATNIWVALRATAITASGLLLFAVGREMRDKGLARPLLVAVALAVVTACGMALLQAYGVETDFFSVNRAPGGTLGNRNSVAHLAAFGFPVVLVCALRAWRPVGFLLGAAGVAMVAGTLVMTRSRAGWLAFAAAVLILLLSFLLSPAVRQNGRIWLRLVLFVPLAAVGVFGAVYLPNSLNWRSDNPYLESMQGITNYQEGSGRGRLVQYRQSLEMSIDHPLLGVGPGNWPVRYPEYAADGDPSLDPSAPGATSNPWPSSDWVAFVAERGFPAALLLLAAAAMMAAAALRRVIRARDADEGLQSAALLATLVAAAVAGAFDAVLLLALPTLLVWLTLGLLYPPEPDSEPRPAPAASGGLLITLLLAVSLVGMLRSGAHVFSMAAYASENSAWMRRAAMIDPGNYRLQLRLARPGGGRSREVRCEHGLAARSLFPNARAARNAAEGCGE